jgi:hypothetical protein
MSPGGVPTLQETGIPVLLVILVFLFSSAA